MTSGNAGNMRVFGLTSIVREIRTRDSIEEGSPSDEQPTISYTCAITTSEKPGTTHFPALTLPELARLIAEAYMQAMRKGDEAQQSQPAQIEYILKTSDSKEISRAGGTERQAFPLSPPDMKRLDDLVKSEIHRYST
jgi:hypothetical protein